jgi:hypothetical protein
MNGLPRDTRSRRTNHWKRANSDAAALNDHDTAARKGILDRRKIGQHQCGSATWPVTGDAPQQKNRWLRVSAQRKQRSEVRIGRDQNSAFLLGQGEYHIVVSGLQAVVAYVHRAVAVLP